MKFALVDCNNFYCSCERVFRPDQANRPVAVLSNNDGCVVSRSEEVKRLGIQMGEPYFKVRSTLEAHRAAVFSSNYALYADLSRRVMATLASFTPALASSKLLTNADFPDEKPPPIAPIVRPCRAGQFAYNRISV